MCIDIVKTHIQINHKQVPPIHIICLLFKYLLKKDFDYANPPYDPKLTKCVLRGEGCKHTADNFFSSVKVAINHQTRITRIFTHVVSASSLSLQRSQGAHISL